MSTDPATIAGAVVLAEELEHMPESIHAEWVKDNRRSLISRLRDSERMRKALELVNETFSRTNASEVNEHFLGDDEHAAWNAVCAALLPEPENANGKS